MTNLTTHCTDLATSRKLKEIGYPQNTYFFWFNNPYSKVGGNEPFISEKWLERPETPICSAYILSELIEILGDKFGYLKAHHYIDLESNYFAIDNDRRVEGVSGSHIQAVANLILKLHEEGILNFNKNP